MNPEEKNQYIIEINKNLKSLVSKKDIFIRGLITGIATAIGATVMAGVVIGGIVSIAKTYNIPIINQITKK